MYPDYIISRFWSKVKLPDMIGTDECWPWQSAPHNEYGVFWLNSTDRVRAHRFSYEVNIGPIPDGLLVCHSCDNPPCVNPSHLWLGTNTDNLTDMLLKGRQAQGDHHGSHLHPERVPRGERTGAYTHPESLPRGEVHWKSVLTADDVRAIRLLYSQGQSFTSLSRQFGVSYQHIARIVRRQSWAHIE